MWAIARIAPPDGRMARVDALTERNKSRSKGRYHQQMTPICQSGNFAYQLFILRPNGEADRWFDPAWLVAVLQCIQPALGDLLWEPESHMLHWQGVASNRLLTGYPSAGRISLRTGK